MFDLFHQREKGVTAVDCGRVNAGERDYVSRDGHDGEGHRNALAADPAPVGSFQQPADQLCVVRADEGVTDCPPTDASNGIRAGLASGW